jgi:uncharacterized protein YndB with AHSA1/START domain
MGKKIGIFVLIVVALFLAYVGMKSPDYMITREITIQAPAEKIFRYMNNSKLAEQWGPWLEVDPQAKMVYSGPDEGVGSRTSWDSEGHLGTGSATIVESVPNERVGIRLEYTKPMNMSQDSVYLIQQTGDRSVVTWRVTGKNGFFMRMISVLMNMDKNVGAMFEKGLINLKTLMEKTNT